MSNDVSSVTIVRQKDTTSLNTKYAGVGKTGKAHRPRATCWVHTEIYTTDTLGKRLKVLPVSADFP